ncbi:Na+/H+ antiporter NhaC family protein [Kushneria phosphatilytica]|uniref:Na+/H+ antiporter NhaC family protein n=1 Tax=Kushneria phosphatilytica TaxID=657387 RepID=A0A1S1NVP7_9GAMM|nr:Na+/H+ antiporter NhaC family protein [Kushneria phosphatilytica]OHV08956.1 sodium:proton antiporter [Kushneria phosphatilytica]QEL09721.1 Na+/H+ antiporter NhaC family protein [Kushneria phosphatilytica]
MNPEAQRGADPDKGAELPTLSFRLGALGAAIPLIFFVIWAITTSILKLSSEIGLVMGAILGLTLGLFFCKSRWEAYAQGLFSGMTQSVGVVAVVAWFYAGMFAQVLQAGGLVDGLVWLGGISGATGGWFTALTFLLAAIFSTAVGTGYGTTVAFCTLMYPAGVALNCDPVILFGAILAGAIFGDNLAPVSDTTIVSAATQEADVPGVVRSRFKYSIMAALPSLLLFLLLGGGGHNNAAEAGALQDVMQSVDPSGLIMLIPFALVLALALTGQHLITSLTWGILAASALIILPDFGAADRILAFDRSSDSMITGALVQGVSGYVNMAILILLIVAASHLMKLGGTMEALTQRLIQWIKTSVRRAELANWAIVALLNTAITINTAAEIAAAPFVRELGKRYNIHRYRRANMLDAVTSALGYIFPWGAPVLLGWSTIQTMQQQYDWLPVVAPTSVFPFVFQGWFLLFIMLFAALTSWGLTFEDRQGNEMSTRPVTDS